MSVHNKTDNPLLGLAPIPRGYLEPPARTFKTLKLALNSPFLSSLSHPSARHHNPCDLHLLDRNISAMIRSSVGSFFLLVLLAALSAFPALAAPQSGPYRASHSPYKDYGSGHPHKRLAVPDGVDSCALSAGELLDPGDQELVSDGIRYSEVCLEQFAFTLVPEERADCRSECPTCTTVRGYDMGCVTERVIRRSSEVDLTQLRDTTQPVKHLSSRRANVP